MNASKGRVGILNFHFTQDNYGAALEGYALSRVLKELSYAPYIINFIPHSFPTGPSIFEEFRKKYLTLTSICRSWHEIKSINNQFDIFLVGSDQVWRSHHHYIYTLGWVEGKKKLIAYAVSFGQSEIAWPKQEISTFRRCVNRFDGISVREESGIEICRKEFGVEAVLTLDPTLLLCADDYSEIIADGCNVSDTEKEYVAYILLDEREYADINNPNILEDVKRQYPLIDARLDENGNFRTFGEWLQIIKNAKYVISSSFHGCALSLVFRKNFVAIETEFRGNERITSLMRILEIKNRFFKNCTDISLSTFSAGIDYETVKERLEKKKAESLQFLKDSLSQTPVPKNEITCTVKFGKLFGIFPLWERRKPCGTWLLLFGVIPLLKIRHGDPVTRMKTYLFGVVPLFSKKIMD